MYEFWYDYVKPKYCANSKLSYIAVSDSFIFFIKRDDILFIKTSKKMLKLDLTLQILN